MCRGFGGVIVVVVVVVVVEELGRLRSAPTDVVVDVRQVLRESMTSQASFVDRGDGGMVSSSHLTMSDLERALYGAYVPVPILDTQTQKKRENMDTSLGTRILCSKQNPQHDWSMGRVETSLCESQEPGVMCGYLLRP